MKKPIMLIAAIIMLLAMASCSVAKGVAENDSGDDVELIIAAAASLTEVTQDIADAYSAVAPNVKLTYTYASSGSLQTQIEQGAPIDIFVSAAQKQMDALDEKSLLADGSRVDLLKNKVVLIVPSDSQLDIKSFIDLTNNAVETVAYGNPESVPAGQYATEVLTSMGIVDAVKQKVNFGNDVRQVLTWVQSGNVDCGIVYATDAATSKNTTIICEAPQGSTGKIIYPVAVMQSSQQQMEASEFIEFLQSQHCVEIFEKYGFGVAE